MKPFLPGLRVRIKELADEARHIRVEEKRAKAQRNSALLNRLHDHRVMSVRRAARSAQLAYAFLRGKPYLVTERTCKTPPSRRHIEHLVTKFSDSAETGVLRDWLAP